MRIDIVTLFPDVFDSFFRTSIVGRAANAGLVDFGCVDIRDFTKDRHRSVDDRPFGGGPGMVLMCGPVIDAVESVTPGVGDPDPDKVPLSDKMPSSDKMSSSDKMPLRVMLTPQGERLTQKTMQDLACEKHLVVLCGHYEGFDERIRTGLNIREISIGDYVLSGGEVAAMVLVDGVVRLLPGALGDAASTVEESFSEGRLEYPQYTRPRVFRGMSVPEVLLSGHHREIEAWRLKMSLERTRERRPDLLSGSELSGSASSGPEPPCESGRSGGTDGADVEG